MTVEILPSLETRVALIKRKVALFKLKRLWKVTQSPEELSNRDLTEYPIDFQLILRAIGTGVLGSHPPEYESYHVFNIELPFRFNAPDAQEKCWCFEDGAYDGDEVFDHRSLYCFKEILIVGWEADMNFYGYVTTENPYRLVRHWGVGYEPQDFVTLVESFIGEFERNH